MLPKVKHKVGPEHEEQNLLFKEKLESINDAVEKALESNDVC